MEIEHIDIVHGDIEYMYYIWQDHGKSIWMSIFETYLADPFGYEDDECIFVGKPHKLLEKYDKERD